MRKIILVAESGGDVPRDLAALHQIYIVPMHVSFGNVTRDDSTFPVQDIYDYYAKTGTLPKTSGCTPEDFVKVFDKIHAEHPDSHILHLAYSAITTCSYQSAIIAAEGRSYVTSVDTKQVSVGQALVVLAVQEYLDTHPQATPKEAASEAQRLAANMRMGFVPDDLTYLKEGGRLGSAGYRIATILHIHPLIEVENGSLIVAKKYRGTMTRICEKLMERYAVELGLVRDRVVFITSGHLAKELTDCAEAVAKRYGFQKIQWMQTGCVVSTHCGPGAWGVAGFAKA